MVNKMCRKESQKRLAFILLLLLLKRQEQEYCINWALPTSTPQGIINTFHTLCGPLIANWVTTGIGQFHAWTYGVVGAMSFTPHAWLCWKNDFRTHPNKIKEFGAVLISKVYF